MENSLEYVFSAISPHIWLSGQLCQNVSTKQNGWRNPTLISSRKYVEQGVYARNWGQDEPRFFADRCWEE